MSSLSTLTILAPDLDAAQKFYCGLLGFAVEASYGPDLVKLRHAGCAILLGRCERPSRPDYPQAAQVVPGLAVADVAGELKRLRAAKVDIVFGEPQEFPAGIFIAARDPAGNVIELLQFNR
jgi:lactoylglutathione lyase